MNNTELFIKYCREGKLDNAIQLLQTDSTINISAGNEYAFKYACVNGNLEVAQWLLTIKPSINISADNGYAFRSACRKGHLEVAQWLQSLLPDKYALVVENNKIVSYGVTRVLPFNTQIIQFKYANKEELICPICYDSQVEVQTNCKHNFCNKCITDYYYKCNDVCKCPYCRQLITSFNKLELINISICN